MKILLLFHNQVETGAYQKILEMATSMSKVGCNVNLVMTSRKNRFRIKKYVYNQVHIYEMPDLLWGRLRQGIDPWNLIVRIICLAFKKFDIIHAVDCRPVVIIPALVLNKIFNTPLVISWWDLFGRGGTAFERSGFIYSITLGKIETFFEEYFRRFANHSIVDTIFLEQRLIELNYPPNQISILRIGCDLTTRDTMSKVTLREEFNYFSNEKIFYCLGTLFDSDLTLLVEALKIVKIINLTLPKVIITGNYSISPAICKNLNLELTGRLPLFNEVLKYLNIADFGLLPMRCSIANIARWPSKSSDYLGSRLPIITTPVSDFPTIFKKYNIGVISKNDTPESFAEAIIAAMNISLIDRENMILSISDFVNAELDWKIISKNTLKIYHKLLPLSETSA